MILSDSMPTSMIILWFVFVALVFLSIFISTKNSKRNKIVMSNSEYIKSIKNINSRYKFNSFNVTHDKKDYTLKSKRQFDTFNCRKKAWNHITENLNRYKSVTIKIDENILLYKKYCSEIQNIKHTDDESFAKKFKMSLKSFVRREKKLAKKIIKKPITNYTLTLRWHYTSPAGRNNYSNKYTFSYAEIKAIVQSIEPKSQTITLSVKTKAPSKTYIDHSKVTLDDIEDLDE